jgi:hypothetical protein
VTVLGVRPDRYFGLRDDAGDPRAVEAYLEALVAQRVGCGPERGTPRRTGASHSADEVRIRAILRSNGRRAHFP